MPQNDEKWSSDDLRTWLAGIGVGLVALAIVVAAYSFGFSRGQDNGVTKPQQHRASQGKASGGAAAPKTAGAKPAAAPKPTDTAEGKKLFLASSCGGCHTLKDAGTSGTVGPDLDTIKPSVAVVLAAIKNGGTGGGVMPAGLYKGADAQAVADYVASVAGK